MAQKGPINYAPLQSILMIPTYAPGYWYGLITGGSLRQSYILGNLTNWHLFLPLIISALCVIYFKAVREMGVGKNTSLLSTFVLFWGTFLMTYTKGMLSEPLNALLILSSFYFFLKSQSAEFIRNNRINFFFAGLLILNNFIFLLYAGLMVAYVAWSSWFQRKSRVEARRVAGEGLLIIGLSVTLFLIYNYLRYGQFLNFGYQGEGFSGDIGVGLHGLLFSFGRGLLFFSPVTVLCLLSFGFTFRKLEPPLRYSLVLVPVVFICYLLLYSKWYSWEGGHCWGPRFLLPFVPLVHLLFPLMWQSREKGRLWVRSCGTLACIWGLSVNFLNYAVPRTAYLLGYADPESYRSQQFIWEESILYLAWKTVDFGRPLWMYLGILALCAALLWYWNKGRLAEPHTLQSSPSRAS